MPVRVLLPNAFQKHTNGEREFQSEAQHLPQLIADMEINFYVNDEDIRFLGNDTYRFQDGDEVLVIPSIAGGSAA